MPSTLAGAFLTPLLVFAQSSWQMDAVPIFTGVQPPSSTRVEIRDRGNLFHRAATREARAAVKKAQHAYRGRILLETVESLDGATVADVARHHARFAAPEQLYILVAAKERDVGVIAARRGTASRLTDSQREAIRQAFLAPLQAGDPDEAFEQGLLAISAALGPTGKAGADSRPRDLLISGIILITAVIVLIISSIWGTRKARNRRRIPIAAATGAQERLEDSMPSGSVVSKLP